jgi:hypothetical protein
MKYFGTLPGLTKTLQPLPIGDENSHKIASWYKTYIRWKKTKREKVSVGCKHRHELWYCSTRYGMHHCPPNILGFFGGKKKHQVFSPAAANKT